MVAAEESKAFALLEDLLAREEFEKAFKAACKRKP